MLVGKINPGSGIGDMLFGIIATRVRAADLGVPYGFVGKEFWKGKGWMNIDFGEEVNLKYHIEQSTGKLIVDDSHELYEINKPYYDPEFNFIPDGSVIDGTGAQDERYWENYGLEKFIKRYANWEQNLCIINIRGGEFKTVPELFLPKSYFEDAIKMIKEKDNEIRFEVHTDDLELAHSWFPEYPIISNIKENWLALLGAGYAIISNSAFAIIPRLLSEGETIAPFGWNARNASLTKWMGRPMNYYHQFTYV